MDSDLKSDALSVYGTMRTEAIGRIAMLEKLLADKTKEQAAEILSIQANITYWQTRMDYAEKYLSKLNLEAVSITVTQSS